MPNSLTRKIFSSSGLSSVCASGDFGYAEELGRHCGMDVVSLRSLAAAEHIPFYGVVRPYALPIWPKGLPELDLPEQAIKVRTMRFSYCTAV
jgi:hypothetical protein